jgi:hypothetical protein
MTDHHRSGARFRWQGPLCRAGRSRLISPIHGVPGPSMSNGVKPRVLACSMLSRATPVIGSRVVVHSMQIQPATLLVGPLVFNADRPAGTTMPTASRLIAAPQGHQVAWDRATTPCIADEVSEDRGISARQVRDARTPHVLERAQPERFSSGQLGLDHESVHRRR